MGGTTKKRNHLWRFVRTIIILLLLFWGGKVLYYKAMKKYDSTANTDGATKLFSRSARNSDINMDCDTDLSALGVKCTINPKKDIKGLIVSVYLKDNDKKTVKTITHSLGNVKEGVQVEFTISLLDLDIGTIWNTSTTDWGVIGGTVSYFSWR